MRVRIEAHDLPGRRFISDGVPLGNVHVGVQVRREPSGLVRADAQSARWEVDVVAVLDDDGGIDLRGPAVHGTRGGRFLYADIDPQLLAASAETDGTLVASIGLTDDCGGGPLGAAAGCAAVRLQR